MANKKNVNIPTGSKTVAASAGGFKLVGFPKEFERNLWETLDKRFLSILLGSIIFTFVQILTLGLQDYETSRLEDKIRQKYLQKFYAAEIIEPVTTEREDIAGQGMGEEAEEEEKVDERAQRDRGKTGETRGRSAKEVAAARREAAGARGAARAQMEQQIAGTGILGVLSAGGGGGTGDAVADVLGGAGGGTGDLDAVLSGVGGLATATSAGQRSRLGSRGDGRATGSADVNDLIQGIGSVGSSSISRKGDIQMSLDDARVSGQGTGVFSRKGDEISRIINSHNDAIEHCFKRESKLNPNLKGDLVVEFIIEFNGRVGEVNITDSTLRNKNIENCIKSRIRSWRFAPIDRAEGNVTVKQKYIFG